MNNTRAVSIMKPNYSLTSLSDQKQAPLFYCRISFSLDFPEGGERRSFLNFFLFVFMTAVIEAL